MITVFNPGNYAQQIFLKEAYATLAAQGNILNRDELEAGKFLSLDGYFAHIEKLVSLQPSYVMIPSDEEPFIIDANTREIKVPTSSFGKCAGIVGDNMCEIITFVVDRYFDYVDLDKTHICVQWKLPGADGEEGISHIGLKDLITTSGKIRFGWPLTKELTKTAGNITFSVRFYKENIVKNQDGTEETQFVYLFNTKTATIPIVAGLNINHKDAIVEQGIADLFKQFVENSENPSYPMPKPVSYTENLPEQTKINENTDTMVLKAQATTVGDGHISYNWYLKEGISDRTDVNAVSVLITGEEKQFDVNHNVFETAGTDWSKIKTNKQYYINDDTEPLGKLSVSYKLVDGKPTFTTVKGDIVPEGTELWERFTTLTIVAVPEGAEQDEDYTKVTGLYHVGARNVVGNDRIEVTNEVTDAVTNQKVTLTYYVDGRNKTPELLSNECYLPTPAAVTIDDKNNLVKNVFIDDATDKVQLKVLPNKDNGNPQRTYTWYRYDDKINIDENGEWVVDDDAIPEKVATQVDSPAATYDATTPGWYYVNINSLLNRDSKNINSAITRVVNSPAKPEIASLEYVPWNNKQALQDNPQWTLIYKKDAAEDDVIDTDGYGAAVIGDIISLRASLVPLNSELDSKLLTDGITYEWYVIRPEATNATLITADMIGENSFIHESTQLNTNVLNVRCLESTPEENAYQYYCKITNTLADKSESLDRDDYKDKAMFLIY